MKFEDWLKTRDGMACMSWPVTDAQYLKNRLWWAFQAGSREGDANAGNQSSQFANQEQPTATTNHE